jgi:hypothetical protein
MAISVAASWECRSVARLADMAEGAATLASPQWAAAATVSALRASRGLWSDEANSSMSIPLMADRALLPTKVVLSNYELLISELPITIGIGAYLLRCVK